MSEYLIPMNTEHSTSGQIWSIKTDGEFKSSVEQHMEQGGMSEQAIEDVFSNAARILSQCPNPNVTNSLAETGIVIGKVQSGKTSNFISVLALAFDNGYEIAVVIGGNTHDLTDQNNSRIKASFNLGVEKLTVLNTGGNNTPVTMDEAEVQQFIETGRKVIIVALKQYKHIQAISSLFDNSYLASKSVIIIDDEGDQATLNTKAYKRSLSSTYNSVLELKSKLKSHCFLSITATPQANILIDVFDKLSPDFGELVKPGDGYCGLPEFHSQENSDKRVYIIDENEPSLLDDEGAPDSVYQAMAMFFVGNAIRYARGDDKKHAMLFHPSQKKMDHEKARVKIQSILDDWKTKAKTKLSGHNDISYGALQRYLKNAYDKLISEGVNTVSFEKLEMLILKRIRVCSNILLCNSTENAAKKSENYTTNIFLGGNLVERGITIDGLAVTYIIRRARGKSNVDNMEQRARWFGYKATYLDVCKVYTTKRIKEDFEGILEHDDDMWDLIERNKLLGVPFKEMPRIFKLKDQMFLRMTRSNVKRTEAFTLSEWKTQKYIAASAIDAENNNQIIKQFRDSHSGILISKTYTPAQVHSFYPGISFECVFDQILSRLVFRAKEVADITFWRQFKEALFKNHLFPNIDVVILRDGVWQTRKTSSDGTIQQLFQGRNPNVNSINYYAGDKSIAKEKPDTLQLQIHYVKPSNDDSIDYYSPVVALYIPEVISNELADLVVPNNE